jgi:hypothetical protein
MRPPILETAEQPLDNITTGVGPTIQRVRSGVGCGRREDSLNPSGVEPSAQALSIVALSAIRRLVGALSVGRGTPMLISAMLPGSARSQLVCRDRRRDNGRSMCDRRDRPIACGHFSLLRLRVDWAAGARQGNNVVEQDRRRSGAPARLNRNERLRKSLKIPHRLTAWHLAPPPHRGHRVNVSVRHMACNPLNPHNIPHGRTS